MAYVYFFILVLIWSYSWVIAKIALYYIDPITFSLLRTVVGTVAIFLFIVILKRLQRLKDILLVVILGLTQTSGFFIFANLSLVNGGAGKVSILIYTMPFWSIVLAKIFLKEPVTHAQKAAIFGALVGLTLIVEPWSLRSTLISDIFALLSAVCWAISIIVAKVILNRQTLNVLSLNAYQMVFGCLGIFFSFFIIPESRPIIVSTYLIFAVLYAGIVATALGWFLWLYILQGLGVNVLSLSSLAVPILTILEAWIHLGEKPNLFEFIGIILIVLSLATIYIESSAKLKMYIYGRR